MLQKCSNGPNQRLMATLLLPEMATVHVCWTWGYTYSVATRKWFVLIISYQIQLCPKNKSCKCVLWSFRGQYEKMVHMIWSVKTEKITCPLQTWATFCKKILYAWIVTRGCPRMLSVFQEWSSFRGNCNLQGSDNAQVHCHYDLQIFSLAVKAVTSFWHCDYLP